jgi:hypothetical protein
MRRFGVYKKALVTSSVVLFWIVIVASPAFAADHVEHCNTSPCIASNPEKGEVCVYTDHNGGNKAAGVCSWTHAGSAGTEGHFYVGYGVTQGVTYVHLNALYVWCNPNNPDWRGGAAPQNLVPPSGASTGGLGGGLLGATCWTEFQYTIHWSNGDVSPIKVYNSDNHVV